MRKNSSISPGSIIKLGIFSGFLGIILFLIIQLLWVESIKGFISQYPDSFWVVIILVGGFFLSGLCCIIAVLFSAERYNIVITIWATLFALLINLSFWTMIAYLSLSAEINAVGIERIIILPKTLAYFAAFKLNQPTELWLYSQITFTIIFCIIFYIFLKKANKRKNRRIKRR